VAAAQPSMPSDGQQDPRRWAKWEAVHRALRSETGEGYHPQAAFPGQPMSASGSQQLVDDPSSEHLNMFGSRVQASSCSPWLRREAQEGA
jgi:hypothetical protein